VFDVIVVGGSYAGISAALQLARARRKVLVLDAGQRRNRFASSSHGFLGQDGQSPAAIAAKGRAELLAYPTVTWQEASVTEARAISGGFAVRAGAAEHQSQRIVLATGVVDELPAIPGLAERWGTTIFHCPYCHGYELDRGRLGVLASSPISMHYAALVAEWAGTGQLTLFLNDAFEPSADELAELGSRRIVLEREHVVGVSGVAPAIEIRLRDGRTRALDGLFLQSRTHVSSPIGQQLGCELDEGPFGQFYKTDGTKETTVPGVFACGDGALSVGSVSFAVADGARAGFGAHQSLVFRRERLGS
jgi:thioredoxin reductase